jgi:hypothetical protein
VFEGKIISLFRERNENENEKRLRSSTAAASKNRQIELEVHNWLYHTKIKDVCGLKEKFLFGLNELNMLVYDYLRAKSEK